MLPWIEDRIEIIRLSFRHSFLLRVFGLLQIAFLPLRFLPPSLVAAPFLKSLAGISWWVWAVGWLVALWLTTLEYSVQRKKRFDETSLNFFKAYLDFLIHAGHNLFQQSVGEGFYQKVKDWQHQAILGIAIGLGTGESEKFFHNMEAKSPLEEAYKKSLETGGNEPLCRALQDHLDELSTMRMELPEGKGKDKAGPTSIVKAQTTLPGPHPQAPEAKRLPPG